MKVFLDTNVLIAAFVARGICKELFEYLLTNHKLYISQTVIDEFRDKLSGKLKFPQYIVDKAVAF
jgi:predicted nucleic acid-binding protein